MALHLCGYLRTPHLMPSFLSLGDDLTYTSALFEIDLRCLIFASRLPYRYSPPHRTMSNVAASEQKTYHRKATGPALATVKRHSKDHELKLFGSCFWYATPVFHMSSFER